MLEDIVMKGFAVENCSKKYSADEILNWNPYITKNSSLNEIRNTASDYEVMLVAVLDAIIERYERNPGYHFIDTKLNLMTGEDFREDENPKKDFRGRSIIYSWIQGRGLEALAGHAYWLRNCTVLDESEKQGRIEKLTGIIREVSTKMEEIRLKNNGHLFFCMTTDGTPMEINEQGELSEINIKNNPINFSDLFYAKGLLAAGDYLKDKELISAAESYYETVLTAIEDNSYLSDQQAFDPKNKVKPVPGQVKQGPAMIALGGIALFMEKTGGEKWFNWGEKFLNYILNRHVNHGQFPELVRWGFIEILDEQFNPWVDNDKILSDTGHALEFIGLALKVLFQFKNRAANTPSENDLVKRCEEILPEIFMTNFNLGYNKNGGIFKAVDLISKKPLNTDMPWWSLPETIRAAAELLVFSPESNHKENITEALCKCSDAFFKNYVNPKINLMAYQTLDVDGRPVAVIPATPDADPGYHTGLSIIDFLQVLGAL